METAKFTYHLPETQIAQQSVEPRDHSRLMIVDRETGTWQHKKFSEITDELHAGDVLVFNNTKVFRARLSGLILEESHPDSTRTIELFLLRAREGKEWDVLVRPGKKIKSGMRVCVNGQLVGHVREKQRDGTVRMEFDRSADEVLAFANQHGEIPIPPYVRTQPDFLERYQTVYARTIGSVAAPTAGFHFTERLINQLKHQGVQCEFITLHVGLGTFRPMKTETVEAHEMHAEFACVNADTAMRINQAKLEKRRVIAVGTTTVRTLEGVALLSSTHMLHAFSGDINLFIQPGFSFKVIDGLITNFHLPKSTLLVLVSAFAGREHTRVAYEEAIHVGYRFFSFGDAMFIRS